MDKKRDKTTITRHGHGFYEVRLDSWEHFHSFLFRRMKEATHGVWRGQRDSGWLLEPSFKRIKDVRESKNPETRANNHLRRFKRAALGRLKVEQIPASGVKRAAANEWWAVGQHYDLATPLLDWTYSAFVALYFAFEKEEEPESGCRAVWGLNPDVNLRKMKAYPSDHYGFEFINPKYAENHRVMSQAGALTRVNLKYDLEKWIRGAAPPDSGKDYLAKISIRSSEEARKECLCMLNKMNINALTLFPDIYGTTRRCNMAIEIGAADYFPLLGR